MTAFKKIIRFIYNAAMLYTISFIAYIVSEYYWTQNNSNDFWIESLDTLQMMWVIPIFISLVAYAIYQLLRGKSLTLKEWNRLQEIKDRDEATTEFLDNMKRITSEAVKEQWDRQKIVDSILETLSRYPENESHTFAGIEITYQGMAEDLYKIFVDLNYTLGIKVLEDGSKTTMSIKFTNLQGPKTIEEEATGLLGDLNKDTKQPTEKYKLYDFVIGEYAGIEKETTIKEIVLKGTIIKYKLYNCGNKLYEAKNLRRKDDKL